MSKSYPDAAVFSPADSGTQGDPLVSIILLHLQLRGKRTAEIRISQRPLGRTPIRRGSCLRPLCPSGSEPVYGAWGSETRPDHGGTKRVQPGAAPLRARDRDRVPPRTSNPDVTSYRHRECCASTGYVGFVVRRWHNAFGSEAGTGRWRRRQQRREPKAASKVPIRIDGPALPAFRCNTCMRRRGGR